MNSPRLLLALGACVLGAAGAWYLLANTPEVAAAPKPAPAPAAVAPVVPAPEKAATTATEPKPDEGKAKMWKLPDGSMVPLLNGVTNPPQFAWPKGRPYARIVGTSRDKDGHDWYEHEDGSATTTQMMYRKDLGRMDATAICRVPADAVPILPEELEGGQKDAKGTAKSPAGKQ